MRTSYVALLVVTAYGRLAFADYPEIRRADNLTVVKATDGNRFLAYSKQSGEWKEYTFKANVTATPFSQDAVCAFQQAGEKITELVAVDARGNWRTEPLPEPIACEECKTADCDCGAVLGDGVAMYSVGDRIYGFSGLTATWGWVERKGKAVVEGSTLMVTTADSIAIFSAETGKWAKASWKRDMAKSDDEWPFAPDGYTTGRNHKVVKLPGTNEFLAYNKHVGEWNKYTFQPNVKAIPFGGASICAFQISGKGIEELVAVDARGNWRTQPLPQPIDCKECKTNADCTCIAVLEDEVVMYILQDGIYGFSALTSTWDWIETKASPYIEEDTLVVRSPDSIAIFSAESGRWSETPLAQKQLDVEKGTLLPHGK